MINNLIFPDPLDCDKDLWLAPEVRIMLEERGFTLLNNEAHYIIFSLNIFFDYATIVDDVTEQLETCIPYTYLKEAVESENNLMIFVDTRYPHPRPMQHPWTKEQVMNQNMHFYVFFKNPKEYILFKLMHDKISRDIFEFHELA